MFSVVIDVSSCEHQICDQRSICDSTDTLKQKDSMKTGLVDVSCGILVRLSEPLIEDPHQSVQMSLAQRVLLTWIFTLIFLILLVLKLDGKVKWSWFLIFLPVWIFDSILLLMLGVKVAGRCRAGYDPRLRVWYLLALMMKVGFCVTLCARLEQLTNLRLLLICVPLWTLLTGAMIQLGYNILPQRTD